MRKRDHNVSGKKGTEGRKIFDEIRDGKRFVAYVHEDKVTINSKHFVTYRVTLSKYEYTESPTTATSSSMYGSRQVRQEEGSEVLVWREVVLFDNLSSSEGQQNDLDLFKRTVDVVEEKRKLTNELFDT